MGDEEAETVRTVNTFGKIACEGEERHGVG